MDKITKYLKKNSDIHYKNSDIAFKNNDFSESLLDSDYIFMKNIKRKWTSNIYNYSILISIITIYILLVDIGSITLNQQKIISNQLNINGLNENYKEIKSNITTKDEYQFNLNLKKMWNNEEINYIIIILPKNRTNLNFKFTFLPRDLNNKYNGNTLFIFCLYCIITFISILLIIQLIMRIFNMDNISYTVCIKIIIIILSTALLFMYSYMEYVNNETILDIIKYCIISVYLILESIYLYQTIFNIKKN